MYMITSYHSTMKLGINNKRKHIYYANAWKLNNAFLNNRLQKNQGRKKRVSVTK